MSDNKKHGSSIGCDAENCEYNENGKGCSARHIKVDGKTAHSTEGTCCATFKARENARF